MIRTVKKWFHWFRSSVSGRFIPKAEAEADPERTVEEWRKR